LQGFYHIYYGSANLFGAENTIMPGFLPAEAKSHHFHCLGLAGVTNEITEFHKSPGKVVRYGNSLTFTGVSGGPGLEKTKGLGPEHCSPHVASVRQATTEIVWEPVEIVANSDRILPSAWAGMFPVQKVSPVIL
jgi:hypothetical protein